MSWSELSRLDRLKLGRKLALAPWHWPAEDHPDMEVAQELAGAPPPLTPGQVPLLTRRGHTGALWSLCCSSSPCRGQGVPLTSDAEVAWSTACRAAPVVLPVLTQSIHTVQGQRLEAILLARHAPAGADESECKVLDGSSVGLSLFLGLSSLVLRTPVVEGLAASATIDEQGQVGPVGGLEQKISVLLHHAPRIRRLLVADVQAEWARTLAQGRLEIIGVSNAREIVKLAFGDVEELVLALGRTPAEREKLVGEWFDIALAGRQELLDWRPFERLAELALERWELAETEQDQLRVVWDIARRHMGLEGSPEWALDEDQVMGDQRMYRMLAHRIQSAADYGRPTPDQALAMAKARLPEDGQYCRSREQVMVRGARARLLAMLGRNRQALEQQQLAIREFAGLATNPQEKGEITYPLTECYRLAGLLGDTEALEHAESIEREYGENFASDSRPFYRVARYRALVLLAPERATEALFQEVLESCKVAFLRLSTLRTRAHQLRIAGLEAEADRLLDELETSSQSHAEVAGRYLALALLDRAVLRGASSEAREQLEELRALQPGRITLLEAGAVSREEAPVHVARCYPY